MSYIITKAIAAFASWGVPEAIRKPLAWIALVVVAVALGVGLRAAYDASVIADHESDRTVDAIEAYDDSATTRAIDAVKNLRAEDTRGAAIEKAEATEKAKPPEARATVTPQTRAFLCASMREEYTQRELSRMKAFQEYCQ